MQKVAIITGASDGLGLETAKVLIEKGWKVVSISRGKPPQRQIDHIQADLLKPSEIEIAAAEVLKHYSTFDLLINNAAVIHKHKLEEIDYEEFNEVLRLNVSAAAFLVSKLADKIKENKTTVLNVGSTISFKAYPEQAAYTVSKWALRGLSEYFRVELKDSKCRVISFNPGGMNTEFFKKNLNESHDESKYLSPTEMAKYLVQTIELPESMEVSEVVVNRNV